ncbi:N-methyl-L-tryptophan oxidase [Actinomycetospora cinnamomea]|uniref:Glycine/D-amino acid oxidase-like deaminating enzyme n=1 Tax=Actinomycetospora cinnamomea TaxID=663609 RepID=A0A2U1EYC5_9PSEU|nr:N-methyl-L-tryptophan oxidase [Actinomycetospora cinnamomea]PVZ04926.1 glycine/D-amino acid oxidase-like deaminating enzyme [Actinomycetospora cinnamomea]
MHSTRSRSDHRYVVVGCGGLGSAAAYWLSRAAGGRVLVLERHTLGHDHGASQDHSRIIRYAQHQDAYAALAPAAYAAWRDLERVSGQTLVAETGGLVIEDVESRLGLATVGRNLGGYAAVADRHGVDFELLDARGVMRRWPQFHLHGTEEAFYQRRTGVVDARRADATHVALARGHGAEVREHSPVRALRPTAGHVEVVLDDEVIRAEHVVVTADARTNEVLDGLIRLPLTVTQEQVTSYATPNLLDFSSARFPVFTWHGADDFHDFHGFPVHGEVATKLGQHSGGHEVPADTRTDEPDPLRRKRQEAFLAEHLPGFGGPELSTRTRLCTIAPDQHDVIDTVPGTPRVSVAVGAGHAFTFASLIGRILADLATTGTTRHPIGAFALDRPALTDPCAPRTSCG